MEKHNPLQSAPDVSEIEAHRQQVNRLRELEGYREQVKILGQLTIESWSDHTRLLRDKDREKAEGIFPTPDFEKNLAALKKKLTEAKSSVALIKKQRDILWPQPLAFGALCSALGTAVTWGFIIYKIRKVIVRLWHLFRG